MNESFLWGPSENYSQEDRLSDSSEELPWKGKGGARIHSRVCCKDKNNTKRSRKKQTKKTHTVKHQKITANHKKPQTSQINGFYIYIILRIESKKYRLGEQSDVKENRGPCLSIFIIIVLTCRA